uniref:Beta-galactosidase n=1 Tax=Trichomonas vaginalis TaxID=5722 RepID=A1E4C9_TRIVA|nr:beta-galactosidase [Trichomonas vaginalis]
MHLMLAAFAAFSRSSDRTEIQFEKGWKFQRGDCADANKIDFDDHAWETVRVPHDWAIAGPFDHHNDLQDVVVSQNFETEPSMKTGRTGGLPYVGAGWYRYYFKADATKNNTLLFDGAMSEAHVYLNGELVCNWPYGYNSFFCDITDHVNKDGKDNVLAVRLQNHPQSSRWYPGAGIYRNVHLITTNKIHVPVWGTHVTTPRAEADYSTMNLRTTLAGVNGETIKVVTKIFDPSGKEYMVNDKYTQDGNDYVQDFTVNTPALWSPETPNVYTAQTTISANDVEVDTYPTTFGFRKVEFIKDKGMFLNGVSRKFQGVCNHHDQGPLGTAVNDKAIHHQLEILKDMGADSIRTSHNMPAPELVKACDEMGFMMIVEAFDEWDWAKCNNGYHRFFNEWAEKDIVNMVRHYRNHPSVILWSVGNEIPNTCSNEALAVVKKLVSWCHREDSTRLVTCGTDQVQCSIYSGFAAALDIPGFNYRSFLYQEAYEHLPQGYILGTETGSTVSSRGVYKLPAIKRATAIYPDHQSTGYDYEFCGWSNVPEDDFEMADDYEWTLGQFVWTGLDYLGEPTPYDTNGWPSHSSVFGIIDLAYIPKDRYYLFRTVWNKKDHTLHMLPHWNWEGYEGQVVPVMVYSDYPQVELFINGASFGKMKRGNTSLQTRYRYQWMNAVYQPGNIRAVAYDEHGNQVGSVQINTAGTPPHFKVETKHTSFKADGKDVAYITVSVVDANGNLCPHDDREISFRVKGAGNFKGAANGNAASVDLFQRPRIHAFVGMLTAVVQTTEEAGDIIFEAFVKGLKSGTVTMTSK